jgi:hypothetical protein
MSGQPAEVMAQWRTEPPEALKPFKLVDESYNSLSFQLRYYDWPQKLTFVLTLGTALIFKSFMGSLFDVTARFDEEGPARTRVTLVGHAHPRTRAQLVQLAEANGGALAGRVIV